MAVDAGCPEILGFVGAGPSSPNSGSCAFTTGCWSEAVACDTGTAAGTNMADASGLRLSTPSGMSDKSKSSLDFRLVVLLWTLDVSCFSADEFDLVETGNSSFGFFSFGTSMLDKSRDNSFSFFVSAINFELLLLLPCQAIMLAVANAINNTINTMPLDQCSHQVRCNGTCVSTMASLDTSAGVADA